jgi:hypothetical protein
MADETQLLDVYDAATFIEPDARVADDTPCADMVFAREHDAEPIPLRVGASRRQRAGGRAAARVQERESANPCAHARAACARPAARSRAAPSRHATAGAACLSWQRRRRSADARRRRCAGCNIVSRSRSADADARQLAEWREQAQNSTPVTPVYGARAWQRLPRTARERACSLAGAE